MKRRKTRSSLAVVTVLGMLLALLPLTAAVAASPGDIVINEVMQNPDEVFDSAGEWFEIYNSTGSDIDINGWTVKEDDGNDEIHVIANGGPLLVPAGGYLVLGLNADFSSNGGVAVDYEYPSSGFPNQVTLANSSDELVLLDGDLTEIDRVEWDNGATFPDPTGRSMSLAEASLDNSIGSNWCQATTPYGDGDSGTPGAENDCPDIDLGTCGDAYTEIAAIQGNSWSSPLDGQWVVTEGVVSADFQHFGGLSGYFLQEGDGDPSTSDGVFVDNWRLRVDAGDRVRVLALVDEAFGETQLTSIQDREVCSSGLTVDPTAMDLPMGSEGREALEGMLIVVPEELAVADSFSLHSFGEVSLSADGALYFPTNYFEPSPDWYDSGDSDGVVEISEDRLLVLDDGSSWRNPDPVPHVQSYGTLRHGDTVSGLTGALSYSFGAFKLQPVDDVVFANDNPRPAGPDDVGGTIQVASFNVYNFWTTIGGRGARSNDQLVDQTKKLVAAISGLGAEIVGLQELENNGGVAIGALVDALNLDAGVPGTWAYIDDPVYKGKEGGLLATNAIKVGIIYQPDAVTPIGDPHVREAHAYANARPPIAQVFEASGEVFTVIVNHFKSKGDFDGDAKAKNLDLGDGQGFFNALRVQQAHQLVSFVKEMQGKAQDSDVLVLGDFNAYAFEDPIDVLRRKLVDLTEDLDDDDRYSYVFYGQAGQLDYAFATPSLAGAVTGADIWHINAAEPQGFVYFGAGSLYSEDPYRSSDHDPVIVGLDFGG